MDDIKYNHLLDAAKELFEALDDEVKFCIQNKLEVSDNSLDVLIGAEKVLSVKSEALKLYNKEN